MEPDGAAVGAGCTEPEFTPAEIAEEPFAVCSALVGLLVVLLTDGETLVDAWCTGETVLLAGWAAEFAAGVFETAGAVVMEGWRPGAGFAALGWVALLTLLPEFTVMVTGIPAFDDGVTA